MYLDTSIPKEEEKSSLYVDGHLETWLYREKQDTATISTEGISVEDTSDLQDAFTEYNTPDKCFWGFQQPVLRLKTMNCHGDPMVL